MDAAPQMTGEVLQIHAHRFPVDPRKKATVRFPRGGANRAEQVDPLVLRLTPGTGPGSTFRPNAGQRALLPEARLVLEPDLDRPIRVTGGGAAKRLGQLFF